MAEYIATTFSPNLVAYASLDASGRLAIQTMKADSASPLISPVLAQKFTNALKKNGTFDDLYLVVEEYLTDGNTSIFYSDCRICDETTSANSEIHWLSI
jgi:hypothetical protein